MYGNWVFLGNLVSPQFIYFKILTIRQAVCIKRWKGCLFWSVRRQTIIDNMVLLIQALSELYPKYDNKDDFTEVPRLVKWTTPDLAFPGHFVTLIRAILLVLWAKKPDCKLRRTEKRGSRIRKCELLSLETLPRSFHHSKVWIYLLVFLKHQNSK